MAGPPPGRGCIDVDDGIPPSSWPDRPLSRVPGTPAGAARVRSAGRAGCRPAAQLDVVDVDVDLAHPQAELLHRFDHLRAYRLGDLADHVAGLDDDDAVDHARVAGDL